MHDVLLTAGWLLLLVAIAGVIAPRAVLKFLPAAHRSRWKALLLVVPGIACFVAFDKLIPEDERRQRAAERQAREASRVAEQAKEDAAQQERDRVHVAELATRKAEADKATAEAAARKAEAEKGRVEAEARAAEANKAAAEAATAKAEADKVANDAAAKRAGEQPTAASTRSSIGAADNAASAPNSDKRTVEMRAGEAWLRLLSLRCEPTRSRTDYAGEVKNETGVLVKDVWVDIVLRDGAGQVITVDKTFVADAIEPDATAPFSGMESVIAAACEPRFYHFANGKPIRHVGQDDDVIKSQKAKASTAGMAAKAGPDAVATWTTRFNGCFGKHGLKRDAQGQLLAFYCASTMMREECEPTAAKGVCGKAYSAAWNANVK